MSTKSSIAYGDNFHLYKEIFDEDNIYLQLNHVAFEAYPDSIVVAIPLAIWEVIRQYKALDLSWAEKTDQDLQNHVEQQVDERIQKYQQSQQNHQGLMRLYDINIYGQIDEPRQQQIAQGIAYYQQLRAQQQELKQKITQLQATNRKP